MITSYSKVSSRRLLQLSKNVPASISSRSLDSEVIGVWIFHRHGDRTPSHPLVADQFMDQEIEFWTTTIPSADRTHFDLLSQKFPVSIHELNNGGKFLDADSGRFPYGFLSWKGMNQLHKLGMELSEKYTNGKDSFRESWNINVFSTNYLRTVKSVQCLLDGLLHGNENYGDYETRNAESFWGGSDNSNQITINVRQPFEETLNAFDTKPDEMRPIIKKIIESTEFREHDGKAVSLAARLTSYIPGLMNYKGSGPSGINWVFAADHFVCRDSHDLNLTAFSELQNKLEEEIVLQALHTATLSHLASRFQFWYKGGTLQHMAKPALSEVYSSMTDTIEQDQTGRKPFTIMSCHDVTILALLYGLKAKFTLTDEILTSIGIGQGPTEKERRYWPEYASHLIFELEKVYNSESKAENFRINVLLNGSHVETYTTLKENRSMDISEFHHILTTVDK